MCAGLLSRPGLSHGAQCEGTCLEVVGRPPTDTLLPAGSRYAAFCTRCCLPGTPQSCPSLPPSSRSSLPARCIHFSFETHLGICHGPTAIKLDQQPLTCCPCAEGLMWLQRNLRSSGGASRLCGSRACSWLRASLGSYLISPPSSSSPFC